MALNKETININFSKGVETKADPYQIPVGSFSALNNSVFDTAGRLTKRNGFANLASLPDTTSKYVTTFNGNLTAVGTNLYAYSADTSQWFSRGALQPLSLSTLPTYRSSTNQSYADSVLAPNGLLCTAFTDQIPSGGVNTPTYKYLISDSVTGQSIVAPVTLSVGGSSYGTPRVFVLGNYFIILYTSGSALVYAAIPYASPSSTPLTGTIASSYVPSSTVNFDGVVSGSYLYIGYNTTAGGQSVHVRALPSNLSTVVNIATFAGEVATMFSMTVDNTHSNAPVIWVSYYDLASTTGKSAAINSSGSTILAPTAWTTTDTYLNITSTAINGSVSVFAELSNNYSYDSSIPTHLIKIFNVTQAGVPSVMASSIRSVGLASKAFLYNGESYFLVVYNSPYQPTYFLTKGSFASIVGRLAYSNGGGYQTTGLPSMVLDSDNVAHVAYLFKDLVQSANKTQGSSLPGLYSQTGINLASFDMVAPAITTAEIGSNLNITGGQLTSYDGYLPVEQGFHVWPDSVEASASASGGNMDDDTYFYQVTYEWVDNQGNLFRSAPSVPVSATVSASSSHGSVTLHIPTLRLTSKISNPVFIVIYRWAASQQTYYQVTSTAAPTLNNPLVDSINYLDTLSSASIAGNPILYTTGGVLENIAPPATDNITLFNDRLWLVDAEDRNLLWYSKQVIESTPIEMSDLLTVYVAPSISSEGSTGPITAIAPMDDKLVIFKENALGYINGTGPDNTGANSQYSDFILITSVVGCTDQNSIVFMPQGLMFQSNKGIWLLGRDLSTSYIGAPVESYTSGATVLSAVNVPATNQVRFTLDTGITLIYDYYYGQWGTFTGIPALSSTIYQGMHTYINSLGQVRQESQGVYLDGTSPVLMSFTTGWLNLAGLQGFERFYYMLLLGTYYSPFVLNTQFSFDYNPSPQQATIVTPSNVASTWGGGSVWGSDPTWGGQDIGGWQGQANVFEARVFPVRQKCESFQISVQEIFDSSAGQPAGAGLTLSGLTLVTGMKRGFRTNRASRSFG